MNTLNQSVSAPVYSGVQGSTQPAWTPADKAKLNTEILTEFLGFDVSIKVPYALLETAARLVKTVHEPRLFSPLFKARSDHYRNCIKLLCCCILHLDLATNTIMAHDGTKGLIPAGNSLARNRLGMHRRVVDECVATLKKAGLYLSNERFKYTVCPVEGKVYQGQHSIKRLFVGLFELVGTTKLYQKAYKFAKEQAEVRRQQKMFNASKSDFGYKRVNERRSADRKERRELKKQRRKAAADAIKSGHPSRTQEQAELFAKGYSPSEIKAHFDGTSPIKDDIPY